MENPDFIVPPPGLFAPRDSDDEATTRVPHPKPLEVIPPVSVSAAPHADTSADDSAADGNAAAPPTGPAPTVAALSIPAFVATPLGAPPRAPAAAPAAPPEPVLPVAVALPGSALPGTVMIDVVPAAVRAAEATTVGTGWLLVLADGQSVPVTGSIVLGRDPAPVTRRAATMVSVQDPARSVSKSHALIELIDGVLWITDLHSTNGVSLVDAHGERTPLDPGIRAALTDRQSLALGEFTVDVSRA